MLIEAGSVHRDHFFDVLRAFDFSVAESDDSVEISRDDPPMLEVWAIPANQSFIRKRHVMRMSRLADIPPHFFWNPDLLARYIAKKKNGTG